MGGRRGVRTAGGLALLAGVLGLVPLGSAQASCAAPTLVVAGGSDPAPTASGPPGGALPVGPPYPAPALVDLPLRGPTTVTGAYFHTGCDDTGQGGPGCDAPPSNERRLRGVDLVLEQGTRTASLGTADASNEEYAVVWRVEPPAGFAPGPAVLRAAGTELAVRLVG